MAISDAEFMLVTTFNPDVKSVERVVQTKDGRIGFWAPDAGEIAQRFAEHQTVIVRVCNKSGKVNFEEPLLEGRAEFVAAGPAFDEIKTLIGEKYSLSTRVEGLLDRAKEIFGQETPEGAVVIQIIS